MSILKIYACLPFLKFILFDSFLGVGENLFYLNQSSFGIFFNSFCSLKKKSRRPPPWAKAQPARQPGPAQRPASLSLARTPPPERELPRRRTPPGVRLRPGAPCPFPKPPGDPPPLKYSPPPLSLTAAASPDPSRTPPPPPVPRIVAAMADDEEDRIPFLSQFHATHQASQGSSAGGNLGRGMGFLDLNHNVDDFPELGSYQQLLFD